MVGLIDDLKTLITHDFLAKSQAKFFAESKNTAADGEFIVCLDFAENYAFAIQNAIQSFHWANTQATVHPYVVYYRSNDQISHRSFVIISEKLSHDAHSVHLFNKKLVNYLKVNFGESSVKKIIYFSDGAGSQYKNKYNFFNLAQQKNESNVECEWNFFASSHGKGACDGVGGMVKRQAFRASLQRADNNFIKSPHDLFLWAKSFFRNIDFEFCTLGEHENDEKNNAKRFANAVTIKNTRNFHQFVPINEYTIRCKIFSKSDVYVDSRIEKSINM